MIAHGKEVKVFAANACPDFAARVCEQLYLNIGKCEVRTFADGEVSVSIDETVRAWREQCGRTLTQVASRSRTVTRLFCGLDKRIKG